MAGGGGDPGLVDSLLETPTYVIALVFFIFLALSMAFELFVHSAAHFLERRGRHGLARAFNGVVMELTLLGFVSLLLTTFSSPLSTICVNYTASMDDWTLVSNVKGCPCCLQHTAGVSLCAEMYSDCRWNDSSREPYCNCDITGTEEYADLESNSEEQNALANPGQPVDQQECVLLPENEVSFFMETAINSIATLSLYDRTELGGNWSAEFCDTLTGWLDDAAIEAQAAQEPDPAEVFDDSYTWVDPDYRRRRRLLADAHAFPSNNPVQLVLETQHTNKTTKVHVLPKNKLFKCTGSFLSSSCPDGEVPGISSNALHQVHIWLFCIAIFHVACSVLQFLLGQVRVRLWRRWERRALEQEAGGAAAASGEAANGAGAAPPAAAAKDEEAAAGAGAAEGPEASKGSMVGGAAEVLKEQAVQLRGFWRFRQASMHRQHGGHWLAEALVCLFQALWPNLVTRSKFLLLREAWLASGAAPPAPAKAASNTKGRAPTPFVEHILDCLESDLPSFVGLSVEMGLVLCLCVLLSGVLGFIGPLFLLIAAFLLLGTNVSLVALLRHKCRGGRPNKPSAPHKWWHPHFLLAIPIRLVSFLCSFVCSSLVFFAWQFGAYCCFFASENDVWGIWGLSWWSGLVMAVTMLIWASAATIPAFALAAHSHHRSARGDPSLHGVTQHSANSKGGALQRGNTAKAMPGGAAGAAAKGSEAEVAALRAEVADLQARMASLQAQLAEAGAGAAGSGHA